MKNVKIGAGLAIVLALSWGLISEHLRVKRLAAEIALLREQLAQAASLRAENESVVALQNFVRLDKDQMWELLRLRGEVGVLQARLAEARTPALFIEPDPKGGELGLAEQRGRGVGAVFTAVIAPSEAAGLTRYDAGSGSKMRIEGTSTAHDWQAESHLILGFLEVGSGFPIEPGLQAKVGNIEARGETRISVNSLVSVKENGAPYDAKMDAKMYEMLRLKENPMIIYRLNELMLREAPKGKEEPYIYDSKGELEVAGVTNKLSMPVNVFPLANKKLKITGTAPLMITNFNISPGAMRFFKIGDEVKVKFEWMLGGKKAATAAAR